MRLYEVTTYGGPQPAYYYLVYNNVSYLKSLQYEDAEWMESPIETPESLERLAKKYPDMYKQIVEFGDVSTESEQ